MSKWKRTPLIPGNLLRSDILEMDGGLRLEVRQTKARSETSDREYSFMLFRTIDGMQSCLWHEEKIPETPGDDIRQTALHHVQDWLDDKASELDAIQNSLVRALTPFQVDGKEGEPMRAKIIAVDFDGTLIEEGKWPGIGATNEKVLSYCKDEQAKGARIILWTNRVAEPLETAVKWCEEHGLRLDAVNDNLPESVEFFGTNTRKIYADEFIDDRMAHGFNLPYYSKPTDAALMMEEK